MNIDIHIYEHLPFTAATPVCKANGARHWLIANRVVPNRTFPSVCTVMATIVKDDGAGYQGTGGGNGHGYHDARISDAIYLSVDCNLYL